jgi:hypothetical protein
MLKENVLHAEAELHVTISELNNQIRDMREKHLEEKAALYERLDNSLKREEAIRTRFE